MKLDLKGATRVVFLIGGYAFKIPNFIYEHQHFLQGCYANWSERKYTKQFKGVNDSDFYNKIAPTLFCLPFGLLSVQIRVKPLLRDLTSVEKAYFKNQTTDIKKENFGYLNGNLVCVDYA